MMTASAGTRGGDTRSDCWVEVSHSPDSAPTIETESKVGALYGDSIRALVQSTLAALDASDVSVRIQDTGALPYVIMARLEAAVKRLRPASNGALPELNSAAQYTISRAHARRSRLYLPGNTPKFFINAGLHQPDSIILDLEDSVSPSEKDAARILVRNALRAVNFYGAEKSVRVNALPDALGEVRELAPHGVHAFQLPKIETADEVVAVSEIADNLANEQKILNEIFLLPLVETARGVMNAYAIASASPRVIGIALGLEDYTRDIGAERTQEGRESWWALGQVVNAARAAGVAPLASVFTATEDAQGMLEWAREMRRMGFEGVGCLHPRQVRAANEAFTPSPDEIERAARIVNAFQQAREKGLGVVTVDERMVDAPVVARAQRTLRLAHHAKQLPASLASLLSEEPYSDG